MGMVRLPIATPGGCVATTEIVQNREMESDMYHGETGVINRPFFDHCANLHFNRQRQ